MGYPDLPRSTQVLLLVVAPHHTSTASCHLKIMAFTEPLAFPWLDVDEIFLAPQELLVCSEAEWAQ